MNIRSWYILIVLFLVIISLFIYWNSDLRIKKLLQSDTSRDVILGAYKAGESGDKKFIPYLLQNAYDFRMCTDIRFKGISVYQSKMIALKKIFNRLPPVEIGYIPDSTVIKFYTNLKERPSK